MRTALVFWISVFLFSPVAHAETPDELRTMYQGFYRAMGYEDYSARMRDSIAAGRGQGPLGSQVLDFNANRFDVFNQSRELAVELMVELHATKDPALQARLAELTSRMLAIQPVEPPTKFPANVFSGTKDEQEKKKLDYVARELSESIRRHTEKVVSDVVTTLYGKERIKELTEKARKGQFLTNKQGEILQRINKIQGHVGQLVWHMYTDSEAGQSRYLGRALALGMTKYAQKTGNATVKPQLEAAVASRGMHLSNYVGNTVTFLGRNGKTETRPLERGTIITENSGGMEAGQIRFAARPALGNWMWAARNKLMGGPIGAFAPIEEVETAEMGPLEYARMKIAPKIPFASSGASHVGAVLEMVDPDSKGIAPDQVIRTQWAGDIYPNSGHGGGRIIDITTNFALPGPFINFGFANLDPYKFYDYAKGYIKKNGYRKTVWSGTKDDGSNEPHHWPTLISEAEFNDMHDFTKYPREKAPEWMANMMGKFQSRLVQMMTDDGTRFATDFVNVENASYCSMYMVLGFAQATGLEIQPKKDVWNLLLRGANALGIKVPVDIKSRIVAPAGVVHWQEDVVDKKRSGQIPLPILDQGGKIAAVTEPPYHELDPEMSDALAILRGKDRLTPVEQHIVGDKELLAEVEKRMIQAVHKRSKIQSSTWRSGHRPTDPFAICAGAMSGM